MLVYEIPLPIQYHEFSGRLKKRYAWGFLKRYYPELDPLPEQPRLEEDNVLLCTLNREYQEMVEERRAERKKPKKRIKKK